MIAQSSTTSAAIGPTSVPIAAPAWTGERRTPTAQCKPPPRRRPWQHQRHRPAPSTRPPHHACTSAAQDMQGSSPTLRLRTASRPDLANGPSSLTQAALLCCLCAAPHQAPSKRHFRHPRSLQRLKAHFEAIVRKDSHCQGPYPTYVLSMFPKRINPTESMQPLTSSTSLIPLFWYRPPKDTSSPPPKPIQLQHQHPPLPPPGHKRETYSPGTPDTPSSSAFTRCPLHHQQAWPRPLGSSEYRRSNSTTTDICDCAGETCSVGNAAPSAQGKTFAW
jgi:hypothetical protein